MTPSPASSAGRRATPRWPPASCPPTCSSTRCAVGRRCGTACGSTSGTSRRRSVRPRSRRIRTTSRTGEDPRELEGRGLLELIVAAVLGALVRTPALEVGAVAEAAALQVIVGDLADALDPERLPAQVLAPVPAAPGPGHPLALALEAPLLPGMIL